MDVDTLIKVIILGIVAGQVPKAEQSVKDAYDGLKAILQNRYKVSLLKFEKRASSKAQRAAIAKSLNKANLTFDGYLIYGMLDVVNMVDKYAPETAQALEIDLKELKTSLLSSYADAWGDDGQYQQQQQQPQPRLPGNTITDAPPPED
jgi:hypothetical protein